MTLTRWDYAFWAIGVLAEAILVLVVLKRGAGRRWPFLLALGIFDICHSALIANFSPATHYKQYFYIYWYGNAVRSFLMLGFIYDVFRAMPALRYVPKNIGLMLLTIGLMITVGSVYLTTLHHPHISYKITYEALMIRECVTVLWIGCAATLLGSISFLGLGWSLEAVRITSGLLLSGMAAMVAASFTSSWPRYGHLFDKLQTCIEIGVFFSWIKILSSAPEEIPSDSALPACIELL